MDGHFRAFSFVDRITSASLGTQIRGLYQIPSGLAEFPGSLVAEAVGQLAAWAAMAKLDFQVRPVAGLAGKVEFLAAAQPGQLLELAADIETAELDAVGYGGTASAAGKIILRLEDCVGPMMPLAEFDDPTLVRERFSVLQNSGAASGVFGGVPAVPLQHTEGEVGKISRATLQVPAEAPFFADHFPRRPVFPGTLLMNLNLQLAAALAAEIPGRWHLASVHDVKLRSFIPPGESLELEARLGGRDDSSLTIIVETRKGKKLLGGARVRLTLSPP